MGAGITAALELFGPVLAPIVTRMARTGAGTDSCLRRGSLPMPVHYYSPVPDLNDLERRKVWYRRSPLSGIDFRSDQQKALLRQLGLEYGQECDWPLEPTSDPYQFHLQNQNFSYGCAASTHCIIRHFKPRRVIEIGSGNSSLVIAAAVNRNARESDGQATDYTIVDPYPRLTSETGLPGLSRLHKQPVEQLEVDFFRQLGENDLLFIDSGHTVRIGGDVNFLILDVLPCLAPGVIVHVHDIGLPSEYPKVYATNPRFRMFWTEAYLLQAFLCFNTEFEVLLAMSSLMQDYAAQFRAAFPLYDPAKYPMISGSFWLRRKPVQVGNP
jgi:Methyltransferase domain